MASAERTLAGLPPCRRYISTHDSEGKSILYPASTAQQLHYGVGGLGNVSRSFAVSSVPVDLADDVDVSAYLSKTGENSHTRQEIAQPSGRGVNLLVVDLAPGGEGQMHRTVTIDFAICVMGRIKMFLERGEEIVLEPSDHVIQRGTMHRWVNASKTEPARLIGVSLPCIPVHIAGDVLHPQRM